MLRAMASTPTTEPTELRAGDTWTWRRDDLADYPASGWALTYYFRNATRFFDVTATADGAGHLATVARATTAAIVAGVYTWVAVASNATERHEVSRGQTTILPDYSATAAIDGRTFARVLLDAVEAELIQRGSSGRLDVVTSALADRSLTRDAGGLTALRTQLKAEVAQEDAAERRRLGLASRNRIHFRG
jgi:hypothetical protein